MMNSDRRGLNVFIISCVFVLLVAFVYLIQLDTVKISDPVLLRKFVDDISTETQELNESTKNSYDYLSELKEDTNISIEVLVASVRSSESTSERMPDTKSGITSKGICSAIM